MALECVVWNMVNLELIGRSAAEHEEVVAKTCQSPDRFSVRQDVLQSRFYTSSTTYVYKTTFIYLVPEAMFLVIENYFSN